MDCGLRSEAGVLVNVERSTLCTTRNESPFGHDGNDCASGRSGAQTGRGVSPAANSLGVRRPREVCSRAVLPSFQATSCSCWARYWAGLRWVFVKTVDASTYAALFNYWMSFSGFSQTWSGNAQFLISPDQRSGRRAFAAS